MVGRSAFRGRLWLGAWLLAPLACSSTGLTPTGPGAGGSGGTVVGGTGGLSGGGMGGGAVDAAVDGPNHDASADSADGPADGDARLGDASDAADAVDAVDATADADAPPAVTILADFLTSTDGFEFDPYHDTMEVNLADPAVITNQTTLTFDGTVGNPAPGSLRAAVAYSGASQYVEVRNIAMFGPSNPANWSGATLHARVRADEGTFGGIAEVYVLTTSTYLFGGTATTFLRTADWQDFSLVVDQPMSPTGGYDPTKVVGFGVALFSGSAGAAQGPVTFHIDTFSLTR